MPRPKPTEEALQARAKRAEELKAFMRDNLFTENKIAETLGISRRSAQMIKSGDVTPNIKTIHKLEALFSKYKGTAVV